jgi:hypothetical protein
MCCFAGNLHSNTTLTELTFSKAVVLSLCFTKPFQSMHGVSGGLSEGYTVMNSLSANIISVKFSRYNDIGVASLLSVL